MTSNEAAVVKECPQCSNNLKFIALTKKGMWKLGFCNKCQAVPAFCQDCQIWFMAEYSGGEPNWANWDCPSCGRGDLPTVTSPMQSF